MKPEDKRPMLQNYEKLPLSFEVNRGQTDARVKFVSRGRNYTLFLTSTEAVLALRKHSSGTRRYQDLHAHVQGENSSARPDVVRMQFLGANAAPEVQALDELPGKSNYFIGNDPKKWHTNVPHYGRVRVHDAWPGVDLIYYGNNGQLEHDFVVAPGANPQVIRLKLSGTDRLDVDGSGDLVVGVREGEVRLRKPVIHQEIAGRRRPVEGGYVLEARTQVAFRIGAYDRNRPLIIDPSLDYGTYLGGNGDDFPGGVAVDGAGNAYVGGTTESTDYLAPNSVLRGPRGLFDIFVTKIDTTKAGAASLVYSTVFGGSGDDLFGGIAIDSLGNAYVAGGTGSLDFPTANPLSCCGSLKSFSNAFVTKLNPAGNQLLFSTYFGGTAADARLGGGIAVDASGNVYIASDTRSSDLPITAGAFQIALGTGTFVRNAFVAKIGISPSNQGTLLYSTYLGGNGDQRNDRAFGIAIDGLGKVYVCGGASSNFPGIKTAFQSTFGGGRSDAFVVKMDLGGAGSSDLLYGTYLGGSGNDQAFAIAVDPSGNAYVVGDTFSGNFPTKNAYQNTFLGNVDVFVAKLNPSVSGAASLVYSTYLRGGATNEGFGIAVNSLGQAYVTGTSDSGTQTFPFKNAIQPLNMGFFDAFIAKLDPGLIGDTSLVYSTYLGGTDFDEGTAVATDGANAYIVGDTLSDNFPSTSGAFQAECASCNNLVPFGDAFLVKISDVTPAKAASLAPRRRNFGFQDVTTTSSRLMAFLTNSGSSNVTIATGGIAISGANAGDFTKISTGSPDNCEIRNPVPPGQFCTVSLTFTPAATGMRTATLIVTDDAPTPAVSRASFWWAPERRPAGCQRSDSIRRVSCSALSWLRARVTPRQLRSPTSEMER